MINIDSFLNLVTAEITVLFVANRQGITLKILCSGAADLQIMTDLSKPMLNKIGEDIT